MVGLAFVVLVSSTCLATMMDVHAYLKDTVAAATETQWDIGVSEQDRKTMMRCLIGLSKVEFDQQLRDTELEIRWSDSKEFLSKLPLKELESAPDYLAGLQRPLKKSFKTPRKLFSYLAKGRTYKGQFDRLLEAELPSLLDNYRHVMDEMDGLSRLRAFADGYQGEQQHNLLRCVDLLLPKGSTQPADGGYSSGKKGEIDLLTYLMDRHVPEAILGNVLVKAPKSKVKPCQTVLETAKLREGSTSEFDAMIIEKTNDERVRIVEMWEAKATIHPATLLDVVRKKYASLENVLEDEPIDTAHKPSIGIFGSDCLHARAAAKRLQYVSFLEQLGKDPKLVLQILDSSHHRVPAPCVLNRLQSLRDDMERLQPKVVVGRDL